MFLFFSANAKREHMSKNYSSALGKRTLVFRKRGSLRYRRLELASARLKRPQQKRSLQGAGTSTRRQENSEN